MICAAKLDALGFYDSDEVERVVKIEFDPNATQGGSVQEKEKALLSEIIAKVNDLFDGELMETTSSPM
ncbi:MAG: hypothetical protein CMI59_00720 [Parvibaculum sp.]|nr:hypothetical protein [Parvibaculum sp.]